MSVERSICATLFLILIVNSVTIYGQPKELGRSFVRFLYGEQWALDGYCNDTRSVGTILSDDSDIESLYNGSHFGANKLFASNIWQRLDSANSIGARTRDKLSVLCSISSWGYANKLLEDQSDKPHEDELECAKELNQFSLFVDSYIRSVRTQPNIAVKPFNAGKNFTSLDHWHQFNSFGRLSPGPTFKSDLLLGDYDGCLALAGRRFCLGAYGAASKNADPQISPSFKIGLCLPSSCSARILRTHSQLMQTVSWLVRRNLLDNLIQDQGQHELHDVHCPPLRDSLWCKSAFSERDTLVRVLTKHLPLIWLCLLTFATLLGKSKLGESSFQRKFIKPFDLRSNWRSFLNSAHPEARLAGLNGAKVICMNWLFMSHISMALNPYLKDIGQIRAKSWHGAIILQGQHGVSMFFIISGLLVGLKHLGKRRSSFRNMVLSRYLRLLPMYLVVYAYLKNFGHHLGEGPLWDYGVSPQSEARQCIAESWLVPILMLANFTAPFAHCVITGWHIANDFQIYLVLPALFWLYRRSRLAGRTAIVAAFLGSHASHVWLWATNANFDFRALASEPALFGPRFILDRAALDYVNPLGRLGTYLIGVLLADLLLSSGERGCARRAASNKRATFNNKRPLTDLLTRSRTEHNNSLHNIEPNASAKAKGAGQRERLPALDEHRQVAKISGRRHSAASLSAPPAPSKALIDQKLAPLVEESCLSSTRNAGQPPGAYHQVLSTFKDTVLLLFGLQAAYGSLFTVNWPLELKLIFGPYSKALAYPWTRLNVELGWTILLYYMLRNNGAYAGQEQSVEMQAKETTTTAAAATTRVEGTRVPAGDDEHGDDSRREKVDKNSHSPSPVGGGRQSKVTAQVGGKFNLDLGGSLLKFRFWNVLVKLNYTLMLVHFTVVRYFLQSQRELLMFSWTYYFQLTSFLILTTYLACLVIHLAVEIPLMALTKLLMARISSS